MSHLPFGLLEPHTILDSVERAIGRRLVNLCRPHSSYINRVYEVQDEAGEFLIAKFFRPSRWSEKALLDEIDFVLDCQELEMPVVPPLKLSDGTYLSECCGIPFAVYPRCGGRLVDEFIGEQWLEVGRLLGRLHRVGKMRQATSRNVLHPEQTTRLQAEYIGAHGKIPEHLARTLKDLVEQVIAAISPLFLDTVVQRIHGDCHRGNLIYRPGDSFFIIDFDDMVMGPPVQDIWMLLPGTMEDSRQELALLLEGYETFLPFDRTSFSLIEPLRAMRYIHYLSWCCHQYVEDGTTRIAEDFGSYAYWTREIDDLADQLQVIQKGSGGELISAGP